MQTSSWKDIKEDGGVVEDMVIEAVLHHRGMILDSKMRYEQTD